MTENRSELGKRLDAKMREIEALVAKSLGLDQLKDRESLAREVEQIVEEHEESMMDGDSAEQWRARETKLADTLIGRLMLERYAIREQILDIQDVQLFGDSAGKGRK